MLPTTSLRPFAQLVLICSTSWLSLTAAELQPHSLRVNENFVDPVGFYDPSPTFSWKLPVEQNVVSQSAFRIVVHDVSGGVTSEHPLWDSHKVDSDQSVWVNYQGPVLDSRQSIRWRVKFWDQDGRESAWSDPASLEMGLLSHRDWEAQWIRLAHAKRSLEKVNILRAEFGHRPSGGSKVSDVTATLRRAVQRGSTPLRVVTRRLGGDPAPGETKTLWVDYEIDGERRQSELAENESFDPYPKITALPGHYFRKDFRARNDIARARLYVSALGICEFHLNGTRVGQDMLTPGYTMYSKRVESLTYDVTPLLQPGINSLGALLGEGWYAGNLLLRKRTEVLDMVPQVIGQLEITYADGTIEKIATSDQWKATDRGPIRAGGFYHGEDFDAAMAMDGWNKPGYDDSSWTPVTASEQKSTPQLVPKRMPATRVKQQVNPIRLTEPGPGRHVFDFGQNLVGVPVITIPVNKGDSIQLRFAEMLEDDGTLYTTNYRTARSQANYIAASNGTIQWQPALSFYGFRYLELSGFPEDVKLTTESVVANVIHTDFESTGRFATSHEKLNQLQSNIRWGQLGNFIDIPTDCPQRDERLGWTGDAQVFLPTSFFNYDVHSFWTRWLQSVRDEQTENGEIPHTVPATNFGYASPGWADVIVTAPWEIYERTGDVRVLRENYQAMKDWVGVYERRSKNLIPNLTGFGDWLQPYSKLDRRGDTAQDLIATAYFGRDARILRWTAKTLDHTADAKKYADLHADIRKSFTAKFFPGGVAASGADTQTACLMGLGYDLIEEAQIDRVHAILLRKFDEAGRHLQTGFLGTPLLAPVFDKLGHPEICYELLFKESYPSWFFSINQGATTMWERWNSYSHADGFGDASMNSFNHYAYGAIGQFLYERVAGLSPDPKHPGYKHFFIRPLVRDPLTWASAELETPYGVAKSHWRRSDGELTVEAVVPPNTRATAILPAAEKAVARIDGNGANAQRIPATNEGTVTVELAPGKHVLHVRLPTHQKEK